MFGNLPALFPQAKKKVDPRDIPQPTPVNLPRYQPFAQDDALTEPSQSVGELLKQTGRVSHMLGPTGLSAIGLDLKLDAELSQLIPDPSYVPDFEYWERLTVDEARERNVEFRTELRNGGLSPGCQVYLERRKELSHSNEEAFRTVRRLLPPKGQQHARLGNTYEFFRTLEVLTAFWDDPTEPPHLPPSPELIPNGDDTHVADAEPPREEGHVYTTRISTGTDMPREYRNNLVNAFIKLVAYDFGCNVSAASHEPRLQLRSPHKYPRTLRSYTPSLCSFIYQIPKTREAARSGIVHGPLAAVSVRNATAFETPSMEEAQSLDLAREVLAGLITAQHRTREGKTEKRFGEGEWWASKPRWGGGPGGPIGREVEQKITSGDELAAEGDGMIEGLPMPTPVAKKTRKGMSVYDQYRWIRGPALTWDQRARYEAIGKQHGTNHDDIFVLSALFHHVSILRIRVPQRLLEVFDGAPEPDASRRSWGVVPAWRSPWYDLFDVKQRIAAIRMMWSVMAYQMRKNDDVHINGSRD